MNKLKHFLRWRFGIRLYKFNADNKYYNHHSLKLFWINVWTFYYSNGFGWFRIFGRGLSFKDMRKHPLMFSQRYCYSRWIRVGKWCIAPLQNLIKQ